MQIRRRIQAQIRWKTVALALATLLGLTAFLSRKAASAGAPQASPPETKAPLLNKVQGKGRPPSAAEFSIPDTTSAINSPTPMSQRVVHYEIDAKYDVGTHIVDATETLTYHNLTGQALDHFPFHLYQNAFQPKSTFVRESKLEGSRDTSYDKWDAKEYGSEDIKSLEVVGQGDLTARLQVIAPDDGNIDDKTVVDVHLPMPIAPGGFVQFKIAFQTKFPETQARSGWKRDFVLGGQWFPKVGVWWNGSWNCHQYHATTEFFADFGIYDVKLTVPQNEVVGASGVLVVQKANPDGTQTVHLPRGRHPRLRLDRQPALRSAGERLSIADGTDAAPLPDAARDTGTRPSVTIASLAKRLDRFERMVRAYPYKQLDRGGSRAGLGGGRDGVSDVHHRRLELVHAAGLYLPEVVVEHEFGHQYWYGMVATNEFEDAWMDEGINSYTEVKVMDSILGKNTSIVNLAGMT